MYTPQQDADSGEAVHVWRQRVYGNSLYFLLNFSMNLKLLKQGLKKKKKRESSRHGTAETNLTRNHEVVGSIPGLTQWVKDLAFPRAVV